ADLGDLIRAHDLPVAPLLRWMALRPGPVSFRPVGALQAGMIDESREASQQCWMRVGDCPLGVGQAMQRAILGFVSDMLLLATAYRPHGLHIGGPEVISASIDHSVWF